MIKLLAVTVAVVALTGCATGPSDYALYAETQRQIATARSAAEIARYQALEAIAAKGDSAASVAAAMGIVLGGGGNNAGPRDTQIAQPRSTADRLLPWASLLVPSLTQFYSIQQNTAVQLRHSDNNLEGKKSDNGMIVDLVHGREDKVVIGTEDDVLLYPVPAAPAVAE